MCPTNFEQYRIGNLYMVAMRTKEETGGGEGIEIVENGPFDDGKESGQLTYKIFHFKSRIPGFIRWAIPDKYLHIHEKSYNSYPHYNTFNSIPGMGDDFIMHVETQHACYNPDEEFPDNLVGLSPEELQTREIVWLDLLNSSPTPDKGKDLNGFVCPEAGINEPLKSPSGKCNETMPPDWTKEYKGEMMVCVKTVRFMFRWRGIQTAVERFAIGTFHNVFLESHRSLMIWSKDWFPMDMEGIRKLEEQIQDDQQAENFQKE